MASELSSILKAHVIGKFLEVISGDAMYSTGVIKMRMVRTINLFGRAPLLFRFRFRFKIIYFM